MPQAIGAAILSVIGISSTATVLGISAAAIIGYGVVVGGSMLVSSLLAPRAKSSSTRPGDVQAVLNQSIGPRVRAYGRVKLGGTRAFWDSKDGALYQIVMFCSHPIDAFEQIWLGDVNCEMEPDGDVTTAPFGRGNGKSWARVELHKGQASQTVSALISEAFATWSADHRLRGIAYAAVRFYAPKAEDFSSVWPQGHNTPVRAVIRAAKVYDPRDPYQNLVEDWAEPLTWTGSDNSGLCILDYIRHPDGMNKPPHRIDFPSFSNFAWLCDEAVPLKGGGTEKRYRLWGTYALTEKPADVLPRMLATCDAELYQTAEGKIAIRGGRWTAPTVTIEDSSILMLGDITEGADAFAAFNELRPLFVSALHDYQPTEAEAWIDGPAQAKFGRLVEDLQLDMVPSPSQARRLAKIASHKRNPKITGSIVTNLGGLNAMGEEMVTAIIPELEIAGPFRVTGFSLRADLTACEIGIASLGPEAYAWNPAAEEGKPPAIPEDTKPDLTLPVPVIASLVIETRDLGAGPVKVVVANYADPGRADLTLHAEIKPSGGSFVSMTVDDDIQPLQAFSDAVVDGVEYRVRAYFEASGGTSARSSETAITPISPPPPGP